MYSNPTYDPNPLAVNNGVTRSRPSPLTIRQNAGGFAPATSLAYQDIFPRGRPSRSSPPPPPTSTLRSWSHASMPFYTCIPPGTSRDRRRRCATTTRADCGGPIAEMLPPSCDTGYAMLGTRRSGATSMTEPKPTHSASTSNHPSTCPTATSRCREFLQPQCYQNAQVYLAFSSIGQKCTVGLAAADGDGGGGDRRWRRGHDPARHVPRSATPRNNLVRRTSPRRGCGHAPQDRGRRERASCSRS